jgi:hypothetical protein
MSSSGSEEEEEVAEEEEIEIEIEIEDSIIIEFVKACEMFSYPAICFKKNSSLNLLFVFIIRSYLNVLLILNIYNDIFICLIRFLSRVIEICSLFRALVLWLFKWRIANVWRIF